MMDLNEIIDKIAINIFSIYKKQCSIIYIREKIQHFGFGTRRLYITYIFKDRDGLLRGVQKTIQLIKIIKEFEDFDIEVLFGCSCPSANGGCYVSAEKIFKEDNPFV